jgi:glycosyltransferase involved in cell wall biosynthesis
VEEKGVEYLVEAFRQVPDPDARLLIAGDHSNVAGGSVVGRIRERMGHDPRIELLGFLPDSVLSEFYASLDIFALPSVNALEAFGIVQVEAMMAGVPVIASGLPGVREPVRLTGFGRVVPPRDVRALADAILELKAAPPDAAEGSRRAVQAFGVDRTIDAYEELFTRLRSATPR